MSEPADARERLRDALRQSLQVRQEEYDSPFLSALQADYLDDDKRPHYGLAGAVLALPDPRAGRDLLISMLNDDNELVIIEAAAALAVLDDPAGTEALLATRVCTNSCIEFFYARAGLTLLGEPIPPPLARQRSVFRHLEEQVEALDREA